MSIRWWRCGMNEAGARGRSRLPSRLGASGVKEWGMRSAVEVAIVVLIISLNGRKLR